MKVCLRCETPKPFTDFYVHARMKDGYLTVCKECVKARVAARAAEKADAIREYERARAQRPQRKADRARIQRDTTIMRPEVARARSKRYRDAHTEKIRARAKLTKALISGRLTKAKKCARCPTRHPLQAHHHDYEKPLEVEWLCRPCHGKEHRKPE